MVVVDGDDDARELNPHLAIHYTHVVRDLEQPEAAALMAVTIATSVVQVEASSIVSDYQLYPTVRFDDGYMKLSRSLGRVRASC